MHDFVLLLQTIIPWGVIAIIAWFIRNPVKGLLEVAVKQLEQAKNPSVKIPGGFEIQLNALNEQAQTAQEVVAKLPPPPAVEGSATVSAGTSLAASGTVGEPQSTDNTRGGHSSNTPMAMAGDNHSPSTVTVGVMTDDEMQQLVERFIGYVRQRAGTNQSQKLVGDDILATAAVSPQIAPEVALIRLYKRIEEGLVALVHVAMPDVISSPAAQNRLRLTPAQLVPELVKRKVLPAELARAIDSFRAVRNEFVHGQQEPSSSDIVRALDSGDTILESLRSIERQYPKQPVAVVDAAVLDAFVVG